MTDIRLHLNKTSGTRCWGTGLIAMDIVETENGDFAATGGSCGNVMAILSWLGWVATPVARLGNDVAGDLIRAELGESKIDSHFLSEEPKVDTPIVIQRFTTDSEGRRIHRFSLTCPECRAWLPRHRPITLKQANELCDSNQKPKAYYFDRVSPGALRLAKSANKEGALVVFEPTSVGDEKKFQQAVDLCHILKYAQDRLGHLPDLAVAAAPKIIIETQGQAGLRFRWRNRWTQLDAFPVDNLIDAAGSGDWCSATLINRIGGQGAQGLKNLRKETLVSALRVGQAIASINCQYFGARGAMMALDFRQLNRRLRQLAEPGARAIDDTAQISGVEPPDFCRRCDPAEAVVSETVTSGQYQA